MVDPALVVADQALVVKTVVSTECLRIATRSMISLKAVANFQTRGQSMEFRLTRASSSTMMALINKVAPQERLLEVVLVTAQEAVRATVQVMGLVAQGVDLMADLAQEVDQIADLALDLGLALVMVQIMDHKMEQMEAKMVAPLDQRTVMGLRSKSN